MHAAPEQLSQRETPMPQNLTMHRTLHLPNMCTHFIESILQSCAWLLGSPHGEPCAQLRTPCPLSPQHQTTAYIYTHILLVEQKTGHKNIVPMQTHVNNDVCVAFFPLLRRCNPVARSHYL